MTLARRVLARARSIGGSGLGRVIPAEIKNDAFYRAITRIGSAPGLQHILEIGASSGAGSTEAFVAGIARNPSRPLLHCLEVSGPRYERLVRRYQDREFVHCYRLSSVPIEAFPSPEDVKAFLATVDSNLRRIPESEVLGWLKQDIDYIRSEELSVNGIATIKEHAQIEIFDAVLIDGSEFTGSAELRETYGARYILLDDICTFKNYRNFELLSADPAYRVVEAAATLRNGYAVFERTA